MVSEIFSLETMRFPFPGWIKVVLPGAVTLTASRPLIANFSCPTDTPSGECGYHDNMGWRYTFWAFGGITTLMWVARFCFKIYETPKFLLGRGRNQAAAEVVQNVARRDGKETWLTVSHFDDIDAQIAAADDAGAVQENINRQNAPNDSKNVIRRNIEKFSPHRIKGLFATPRMALSTTLMLFLCKSCKENDLYLTDDVV